MPVTVTIASPEKSSDLVKTIAPLLNEHQVFCFHGELGAGKTTYIKAICDDLGVQSQSSSPSFSIVNEYELPDNLVLYHFDLYRINKSKELEDIGWFDYLNSNHLIFVEWPEMADSLMPDDAVHVNIQLNEDDSRTVTINLPT